MNRVMPGSSLSSRPVDRDALRGAAIAGGFGLAWTQWGASGLTAPISVMVRVIGGGIGIALLVRAVRARRRAPAPTQSMFRSRPYRLILLGELVALGVGIVALAVSPEARYIVAWGAAVVGIHFIALARFSELPYALGVEVLLAGAAGLVAGVAGASPAFIEVICALPAAAALFVAGLSTLLRARRAQLQA